MILSGLRYCYGLFAGLLVGQMARLQSVLRAAARFICDLCDNKTILFTTTLLLAQSASHDNSLDVGCATCSTLLCKFFSSFFMHSFTARSSAKNRRRYISIKHTSHRPPVRSWQSLSCDVITDRFQQLWSIMANRGVAYGFRPVPLLSLSVCFKF